MKLKLLPALFASAFLLTACGEDSSPPKEPETKVSETSALTKAPTPAPSNVDEVAETTEETVKTIVEEKSVETAKVEVEPQPVIKVEEKKEVIAKAVVETPEKVESTTAKVTEKVQNTIQKPEPTGPIKGDAALGQSAYGSCIGCHGAAGEGGVGPKLAGADPKSTIEKLTKYKNGETLGPMTSMMAPMALSLSEADMANIAEYVAGL